MPVVVLVTSTASSICGALLRQEDWCQVISETNKVVHAIRSANAFRPSPKLTAAWRPFDALAKIAHLSAPCFACSYTCRGLLGCKDVVAGLIVSMGVSTACLILVVVDMLPEVILSWI